MYSVFGKLFIPILAIAAIVFPCSTFSQTKIEAKSSVGAKSKTEIKRANPSARLPYNAVPIVEYLDKLSRAAEVKPRGEFETKEAYEARLSQKIAFPPAYVLIESDQARGYYYNVDERMIEIYIHGVDKYLMPKEPLKGTPFEVAYKSEYRGTYLASNGFGATVTVERRIGTQYLLYVEQEDLLKMVKTYMDPSRRNNSYAQGMLGEHEAMSGIVIQFGIDPDRAKQLSKSFRIYMKIVADGRVSFEATDWIKPTMEKPRELSYFTMAASVRVEELIVRDEASKSEVFKLVFQ